MPTDWPLTYYLRWSCLKYPVHLKKLGKEPYIVEYLLVSWMVCSPDSVEVPAGWSPTPMFSIFDEVSLYELLFTIGRFMVILFCPSSLLPRIFSLPRGRFIGFLSFFFSFFLSFFWAVLCAERGTYSEEETSDEGSQHRCGRVGRGIQSLSTPYARPPCT